jgi:hypothetical protein
MDQNFFEEASKMLTLSDKKTGVNYQRCLSGKETWIIRGWLGLHWVMAAIVDCSA